MDWNKLSKEQQQQFVLVGLVAVTACYIVFAFGIKPMSKNWGIYKTKVKELSSKVRNAEVLTSEAPQIAKDMQAANQELIAIDQEFMAEEVNPFAWASRKTYDIGRQLGLELEITQSGVTGRGTGGVGHIAPYAINVHTECSYPQLIDLVSRIQAISPYTTVANLVIAANPQNFDKHSVTLKVQWPVFKNPKMKTEIHRSS